MTKIAALESRSVDPPAAPLRVVVSKVGLDGHDRGVKVIAQGLRDAGLEVIYAGLRRSPKELASILIQEDAAVLGLSILSGAVVPLTRAVVEELEAQDLSGVILFVGGIISPADEAQLRKLGVQGIFGPGTPVSEVVESISACHEKGHLASRVTDKEEGQRG